MAEATPIPLLGEKLMVGRRSRCDITLQFPNVSSHHCELELINGFWRIRDLGSRNGIKVNGKRCDVKWLMPRDILSIAKHKYEVMYEPDGSAPPPVEENLFELGLLEKAGLETTESLSKRNADKRSSKVKSTKSAQPQKTKRTPQAKRTSDDDVMDWLSEDGSA